MARNDWVASAHELSILGATPSLIASWLRSGRLVQVAHGVYCYGRDIETPEATWRTGLLVAGPSALLTGRSACELWGYVRPPSSIPARIQIASPRQKAVRFRGRSPQLQQVQIEVVHRSIPDGNLRLHRGLAVTSPVWTLIDLAVEASPVGLRYAYLEACRLGHFQQEDVTQCFRQLRGRRGAVKLRELLSLWVPELNRINSPAEGLLLLGWAETGRPLPRVNHPLFGLVVDFYWPEFGLVVEVDGAQFHSDPLARRRDAMRDARLRDRGLHVIRYPARDVDRRLNRVIWELTRWQDAHAGQRFRDRGVGKLS